ncbi:MAG TPA: HDOD domain-containing protein [Pyrinomonadaceae bacterium]|nr:HDOD domain-containing protein [Pyrinomonadaceae bacterium]
MIPHTEHYDAIAVPFKPRINIETLVETKLPPSPGSLMRISNLLRDYNASTRKITEAINYEPILVARILRLANSPIYSLERNVTSVQTAIDTVGTKAIYDIVLMGLASATFSKEIRNSPIAQKIWEHSLAVAMIAREVSQTLGMRGTEEAFTCGLLHDLGKIILLSNDLEGYTAIAVDCGESELLNNETQLFGFNHAEVGSLVARRWGLPDEVCYTILHHHNPSQSDQAMLVAHIVDVSDMMANVNGYGVRLEDASKLEFSESVMKLGLSEEHIANIWHRVDENISEVIRTFS